MSLNVCEDLHAARTGANIKPFPLVHTGVLVTSINPRHATWQQLQPGDVITHLAGMAVGVDGTVEICKGLRVHLNHVVASQHVGEELKFGLWRNGRAMEVVCR